MTNIYHTHAAKPKRRPKLKVLATLGYSPIPKSEWHLIGHHIGNATAPAEKQRNVQTIRREASQPSRYGSTVKVK